MPSHNSHSITLPIKLEAYTSSRWSFDRNLADRAISRGITLLTNTYVDDLILPQSEQGQYVLKLSSGDRVVAKKVVIGAGRLVAKLQKKERPPATQYWGFKGHLKGIDLRDVLEMHLVKDGYVGIVNIEERTVNVAGLLSYRNNFPEIPEILTRNLSLNSTLSQGQLEFSEWMKVKVPRFGKRHTPNWPNAYFVGDAAGTLPPATGSGLAMGLISGVMAAAYITRNDYAGFKNAWHYNFSHTFRWGKLLHALFMSGMLRSRFRAVDCMPAIVKILQKNTRVSSPESSPFLKL